MSKTKGWISNDSLVLPLSFCYVGMMGGARSDGIGNALDKEYLYINCKR